MATVEAPVMDAPAVTLLKLTAQDRCDRCGAQAFVATSHRLPDSERAGILLWCAHHFREHRDSLRPLVVLDQRPTPAAPV